MAKVSLATIKNWFRTALKPTQQQFWDTWDSYWHKDDSISTNNIEGLDNILSNKADADVLNNHISDNSAHNLDRKVDKEEGKGLSAEDFTTPEKEKLASLRNVNYKDLAREMLEKLTYTNTQPSIFLARGVPRGTTFNEKTLKEMFDMIFYGVEAYPTEIKFQVTIGDNDVNRDIPLISLYNISGQGTYTITTSDGFRDITQIPKMITREVEHPDGGKSFVDEGAPITHRWKQAGVYTIDVTTSGHVTGTKFTHLKSVKEDRITYDVENNPFITKIIQYSSKTISRLDYTFAGLSNCVPDEGFILETPEVDNAYATFFKFGSSAWRANAAASLTSWSFSKDLLKNCGKLTSINGMFYLCNLKRIPVGFFDALVNVVDAYDVFKRSALGHRVYTDYTQEQYIKENLKGESFIPMNLLHTMNKLVVVEGMFNAIATTSRDFFGTTGDHTTNSLGYGNWCNLALLLKADFFKNNGTSSTIANADYLFGKVNQCAFEKDLFRYCRISLERMEGVFFETHWVINDTASQRLLFGNDKDQDYVQSWYNTTTQRLENLLGTAQFPNVKKLNGAFTVSEWDYSKGFNGTYDVWGMGNSGEQKVDGFDAETIDKIRALFPNIETNPAIQSPTDVKAIDGLSGALYNLKVRGTDKKEEAQSKVNQQQWDMIGKKTVAY